MQKALEAALADIRAAVRMHRVWLALASEDIGDQHRRTTLGPAWLIVNYLSLASIFIFVFGRGPSDLANYPAYLATGLFVWFFIMETITQSVMLFVREEGFIKGTTLPLPVYMMRLSTQAVFRGSYALLGCLIILAVSQTTPQLGWAWALPGMALIIATTPAVVAIFAFTGAFFPDSQFIVSNLMRLGMFLTPVFWAPSGSNGLRNILYHYNPFTYFVELVRIPVLTGKPSVLALALCTIMCVVLWFFALLLLGLFRKKVVFAL